MEKFIENNPALIYLIISLMGGALIWFIQASIKESAKKSRKHEDEIKKVSDRADDIENNYKNEFKLIRNEANERHEIVLDVLGQVKVELATVSGAIQTQTKVCESIQSQKRH